MKIKMLRFTVVDGSPVKPGEVVETNELDARMLIGMRKAALFVPRKPKRKVKQDVS